LIITVSEDDIDFGDNDDLNEVFIEDDDDWLEPNEGEIIFKLPFIDWLLFHLLLLTWIKFKLVFELVLAAEFDEFKVSCTAEAAAASCGEGAERDEGDGEDKAVDEDEEEDLDDVDEDEQLDENDEQGEFLLLGFLKLSLNDACVFSILLGTVTDWVIETTKTPLLGTGGLITTGPFGFAKLTSDKRFEWFLKLST